MTSDAIGSLQNPAWAQLDLRAQDKKRSIASGRSSSSTSSTCSNNQDSIRDQDLVAGAGATAFGQPIRFLDPRRFFLGARLTF